MMVGRFTSQPVTQFTQRSPSPSYESSHDLTDLDDTWRPDDAVSFDAPDFSQMDDFAFRHDAMADSREMADNDVDSGSECDDPNQFATETMIIEYGDDVFTALNGTTSVQPSKSAVENASTQWNDDGSSHLDKTDYQDTQQIDDGITESSEEIGDQGEGQNGPKNADELEKGEITVLILVESPLMLFTRILDCYRVTIDTSPSQWLPRPTNKVSVGLEFMMAQAPFKNIMSLELSEFHISHFDRPSTIQRCLDNFTQGYFCGMPFADISTFNEMRNDAKKIPTLRSVLSGMNTRFLSPFLFLFCFGASADNLSHYGGLVLL